MLFPTVVVVMTKTKILLEPPFIGRTEKEVCPCRIPCHTPADLIPAALNVICCCCYLPSQALVKHYADTQLRNARGLTPMDVAQASWIGAHCKQKIARALVGGV